MPWLRAAAVVVALLAGLGFVATGATPDDFMLVDGLGWAVAENLRDGASPLDGGRFLSGGGAGLGTLFGNVSWALVAAPVQLALGPGVATQLLIALVVIVNVLALARMGAGAGMPWIGALLGANALALFSATGGRPADALGGLAVLGLCTERAWPRRLWFVLGALLAPWPTAGACLASRRVLPGVGALAVGLLAPPVGSAAHPASSGDLAFGVLAGGFALLLLGERRWRGAGLLLGLGLLVGLDPPPVQGLDIALLPLPAGEGIAVAALWAAPVLVIRYLRAEGRVATRALLGAVLLVDLIAAGGSLSRPVRPPPSALLVALAVDPGTTALSVLPDGSVATVGLLPDHRQLVVGLPRGGRVADDNPPPMGLKRGTLLVGASSAEASVLATALGAPRGVGPGLAYWAAP